MLNRVSVGVSAFVIALATSVASSQDWPQWRGPQRDGRATAFHAPDTWPAQLTKGWSVTIGDGVATPALVGERLYAYARQDGDEVLRCLNAANGESLWDVRSPADELQGGAGGFPGPRCSPTVADDKVVVLGVEGRLSCLNAATGDELWRNTTYAGAVPRFATSSSPIVVDGLCIAQLGDERDGGIFAFDLATGEEKWKWTGDGPAYGSPIVIAVDGTPTLVMPTNHSMVALDVAGHLLWQIEYSQGRYNSATPIGDGQTLIVAGPDRGMSALKLHKAGDAFTADKAWTTNPDLSVQFNTPVLRDGLLYGLTGQNSLFCLDAATGETLWTTPASGVTPPPSPPASAEPDPGQTQGQDQNENQGRGRGRGRRGGRGGGGRGGYGSVVDAGAVMLALTPDGNLIAFAPASESFQELARYKVAERGAYAYPIAVDRRIFIKDQESLTVWTLD